MPLGGTRPSEQEVAHGFQVTGETEDGEQNGGEQQEQRTEGKQVRMPIKDEGEKRTREDEAQAAQEQKHVTEKNPLGDFKRRNF